MATPMDLDALIAQEDARRALWAEADAAFRSDVEYAITMAEDASAAHRGVPMSRVPRDDGDEAVLRRREADRRRWHARKAARAAAAAQ